MKLITVSVGDRNHEPRPEEIDQVKEVANKAIPDEYTILAYPYYVDVTKFEDVDIDHEVLEKVQEKIVEQVKAKTEVRIQ